MISIPPRHRSILIWKTTFLETWSTNSSIRSPLRRPSPIPFWSIRPPSMSIWQTSLFLKTKIIWRIICLTFICFIHLWATIRISTTDTRCRTTPTNFVHVHRCSIISPTRRHRIRWNQVHRNRFRRLRQPTQRLEPVLTWIKRWHFSVIWWHHRRAVLYVHRYRPSRIRTFSMSHGATDGMSFHLFPLLHFTTLFVLLFCTLDELGNDFFSFRSWFFFFFFSCRFLLSFWSRFCWTFNE